MEVGIVSLRDICSHFRYSNSTIPKIFKKFDIEYPKLKKGRKSKVIDQNIINVIFDNQKVSSWLSKNDRCSFKDGI